MAFVCIFSMMGLETSKAIVEVVQVGDIGLKLYRNYWYDFNNNDKLFLRKLLHWMVHLCVLGLALVVELNFYKMQTNWTGNDTCPCPNAEDL